MKKIKNKETIINLIVFILLPIVYTVIIESLASQSFFGGFIKLFSDPYIFLCNALIVAMTLSPAVLFRRFRYFIIGIVSICWIALGTANCIILSNRTLPFTAYDLQMLDTLPLIIRKYLGPVYLAGIGLALALVLLLLFAVLFKGFARPREKYSLKMPVIYFVIIVSLTCANTQLAICAGALDSRFPELPRAFDENGFVYSFLVSLFDNGIDRVDGYSEELIESITACFEETDEVEVRTPNIIFLQMESFFDTDALKNVSFSADPIPIFRRMASQNPSGLLTVPVIGAGTSNTEFEVVTGMNTADFGAGEYPFKTLLTENTCESVAYNVKAHGYTSHFIHNYTGGFYSRNVVYSNLGYDRFFSLEYMSEYENNENGWARDAVLLPYIIDCLDSTEGSDLITTISVQAHGSYGGITDFKRNINVTSCFDQSLTTAFEYYINQIYEMDIFLGELERALWERDEETVLVVYGDHLPSLEITDDELVGRTVYQTDYVIWSNTDIDLETEDMYAYQLSSRVLEALNIKDGVINSCHQSYRSDEEYLFNLRALEYDMLYGKRFAFGTRIPYTRTDMSINKRELTITGITKKEGEDNVYVVSGRGFTRASYVRIGDAVRFSRYIDTNTIEFNANEDELTKPVRVCEKGSGVSEAVYIN